MRLVWILAFALTLATPLAQAQGNKTGNPLIPNAPTGNNQTAPSPSTGNNGTPVGPAESNEGAPGITYGILVLVGVLAFAGVLGYVTARYRSGK
jgi:hypothetical protein